MAGIAASSSCAWAVGNFYGRDRSSTRLGLLLAALAAAGLVARRPDTVHRRAYQHSGS